MFIDNIWYRYLPASKPSSLLSKVYSARSINLMNLILQTILSRVFCQLQHSPLSWNVRTVSTTNPTDVQHFQLSLKQNAHSDCLRADNVFQLNTLSEGKQIAGCCCIQILTLCLHLVHIFLKMFRPSLRSSIICICSKVIKLQRHFQNLFKDYEKSIKIHP